MGANRILKQTRESTRKSKSRIEKEKKRNNIKSLLKERKKPKTKNKLHVE
jgi:hypothetical protein